MVESKVIHTGHCLCGDIGFTAEGDPKWAAYCYCESCRRHTGAPISAYAGFLSERVTWRGTPATYVSSPGVSRGFCGTCGSTLYYQGSRWPGETHLHLGIFDDPSRIVPEGAAFPEDRVAWLHLREEP